MREEESAPSSSSGSRPTSNSKNTKKKCKMMHVFYPYTFFFILLVQYCFVDTKRKREGISTDVLEVLGELEERADHRWFTMEEKRMKLEAELEEKRRCEERNHELRIQKLRMGCMQQMFTNFAPHPPMYSHQAPFPHRTPTHHLILFNHPHHLATFTPHQLTLFAHTHHPLRSCLLIFIHMHKLIRILETNFDYLLYQF